MYWHGYPMTFDQFLDMPVTDRYLATEALNDLIEQSNEQGGDRPKDHR
jgi:hypothetical protein